MWPCSPSRESLFNAALITVVGRWACRARTTASARAHAQQAGGGVLATGTVRQAWGNWAWRCRGQSHRLGICRLPVPCHAAQVGAAVRLELELPCLGQSPARSTQSLWWPSSSQ